MSHDQNMRKKLDFSLIVLTKIFCTVIRIFLVMLHETPLACWPIFTAAFLYGRGIYD